MQETITLGEREYTLQELPLRKARAFRENLRTVFADLASLMERAPQTNLNDTQAVAHLIRSVSATVLDSLDTALDLLCEYSQEIAKDREYIEDHAVGSQVIDAFAALLPLVFPFLSRERMSQISRAVTVTGRADKAI